MLIFLFLLYLRFVAQPAAIRNNHIKGKSKEVMTSKGYIIAFTPVTLTILLIILIYQLYLVGGKQSAIVADEIKTQINSVNDFLFNLEEIRKDMERFDQATNRSIKLYRLVEKMDVLDDKSNYYTKLFIRKNEKEEYYEPPILRYEIGRVYNIKDVKLELSYEKSGKEEKMNEEDYVISPHKLIAREIGLLSVRLKESYFDKDNKAVINLKYELPQEDSIVPFYFVYYNPRDYGEDVIKLFTRIKYHFNVSQPKFLEFDKETRMFNFPIAFIPPETFSWEFSDCSLKLSTKPSEKMDNPLLIIFERMHFPKSTKLNFYKDIIK